MLANFVVVIRLMLSELWWHNDYRPERIRQGWPAKIIPPGFWQKSKLRLIPMNPVAPQFMVCHLAEYVHNSWLWIKLQTGHLLAFYNTGRPEKLLYRANNMRNSAYRNSTGTQLFKLDTEFSLYQFGIETGRARSRNGTQSATD